MSKIPFIHRFLFFVFIFLVMFHVVKFEPKNPFISSSNSFVIPDFSLTESLDKHEIIIENSVIFPDFVLIILSSFNNASPLYSLTENRIDCLYNNSRSLVYPMLSIDEYDSGGSESRWFVRCPLPPTNTSSVVGLEIHGENVDRMVAKSETTSMSWGDKLVYEAIFDGEEIIAVLVKGLGLNGEKKSNASQFNCRFGEDFSLVTKAITAAQEVIRCPLPLGVTRSSIASNNEVVEVTLEKVDLEANGKSYLIPSIAKLPRGKIQRSKKYKHEVCACTMVWNQGRFIREWIMYHSWLGIERWFVYDNNSNDRLESIIDGLNSENYNVSRHNWPWLKSQEAGFAHCLLKARDHCNWVAFFDVDEYYYFPTPKAKKKGKSGIINNLGGQNSLRYVVQNTSSMPLKGQIKTNCYNFGPSNLTESPKEGVPLAYTCRLKIFDRHKSIVRPDTVDDSLLNRIHHFELKTGFSGVTLDFKTAVINHYKYPVWDVFKAKFERRVSAYVVDWKENKNEESKDRTPGLGTQAIEPEDWNLKFCEVWDTRLKDFIIANLANPNTTLLHWQKRV